MKQKEKSRMENQGKLTQDKRKQTKRNTTKYVLDTTISKQAQAT